MVRIVTYVGCVLAGIYCGTNRYICMLCLGGHLLWYESLHMYVVSWRPFIVVQIVTCVSCVLAAIYCGMNRYICRLCLGRHLILLPLLLLLLHGSEME